MSNKEADSIKIKYLLQYLWIKFINNIHFSSFFNNASETVSYTSSNPNVISKKHHFGLN